ncbi:centrosomal protein of 89 kDa-like [Argonauta hians]
MVKTKNSKSNLRYPASHISSGVIPKVALVAVPNAVSPICTPGNKGAPLMGALMNSSNIGRMFGSPVPSHDFDNEDDSIMDYTLMTDAGYLNIPFEKVSADLGDEGSLKSFDAQKPLQRMDDQKYIHISSQQEPVKLKSEEHQIAKEDATLLMRDHIADTTLMENKPRREETIQTTDAAILYSEKWQKNVSVIENSENPDKSRIHQLKEELKDLRDLVYKLNRELSRYQAKFGCAEDLNNGHSIVGLPSNGPVPSWLISTKYLSPLIFEYEKQANQQEKHIATYKEEIEQLSKKCQVLVDESELLHEKIDKLMSGSSNNFERSLTEQQLDLIREENNILSKQLKNERFNTENISAKYSYELNQLKEELKRKNESIVKLEMQLREERIISHDLKDDLDQMKVKDNTKIQFVKHQLSLEKLQSDLEESIERHIKEKVELTDKLEKSSQKIENFIALQSQCKNKIERMHNQMKDLKIMNRKYVIKNQKLTHTVRTILNQQQLTQNELQKWKINEDVLTKLINKTNIREEKQKKLKETMKIYKKKLSEEQQIKKETVHNIQEEFQLQIRKLYSNLKQADGSCYRNTVCSSTK